MKAKAKADRAAARQAAHTSASASTPAPSAPVEAAATPTAEREASTPTPVVERTSQEAEEGASTSNATPAKEAPPDRTELLRSKPAVVGRFVQLLMPILIDVYAASVITPVRTKTLTGLLKALSFLDADAIKKVFLVSRKLDITLAGVLTTFLVVRSHRRLRLFHPFVQGSSIPRLSRPAAR